MSRYDVVVVGLGGAGSSAAFHLSAAGLKVLGLEQFGPLHDRGSSHGRTRIYRTAYFEGEAYVPLVRRAQQLWHELQGFARERIIQRTGGLTLGRPDGPTVRGARRSAAAFALPHEMLSPEEVRARFPQFSIRGSEVGLWDPDAGVLFPENCLRAHAAGAAERGAELHYGEAVTRWSARSGSVEVDTKAGNYRARSLVLTVGPWTRSVVSDLALPLTVERQFVFWFPPSDPDLYRPGRMPVFLWDARPEAETYGIPDLGDGVKVGSWKGKVAPTPEEADRSLREEDAEPVRAFVRERLPGLVPRETESISCLYTNSPDHHFLVGPHPRHPNVVVVSACSGHGFKFTSVLGEIVSRLLAGEEVPQELSPFDPGRFRSSTEGRRRRE